MNTSYFIGRNAKLEGNSTSAYSKWRQANLENIYVGTGRIANYKIRSNIRSQSNRQKAERDRIDYYHSESGVNKLRRKRIKTANFGGIPEIGVK